MPSRVMIVDDHPVVRAGIRALLANEPDLAVVGEAGDGAQAIAIYDGLSPDVLLMDLRMPNLDGISAIRAIIGTHPRARVVALTTYEGDADIHRALEAGACGYLLKNTLAHELAGAVRSAASGRRVIPAVVAERLAEFTPRLDLTPRELEVLEFAAKGLRNKEIARMLGRTEDTIKVHLRHIMEKLGVSDRTEVVTLAYQRGIIHL